MKLLSYILFSLLVSCVSHQNHSDNSSVKNTCSNQLSGTKETDKKISDIKYDEIKNKKKQNVSVEKTTQPKGKRSK